ncbi:MULTISPECIES: sensor histidine kinase [Reichenbachiella]|uniref:sensor histidine kinase n=1 Tax=Reichenbachiella TaxID=156993 RepID=UPI000E6B7835|nr:MULTISPECIES: HAMP domain-containing sensor histidine kinase [Reichenbachiella]MBU2914827.1 HAMP domain-containing histidine kinase [Reichenbachiella agariperforans]RJE75205.1 two-component sensor histidine kinase [Reichenbachiella sp. MSK19-1]
MKTQNKIIFVLIGVFVGYTIIFSVFIYYNISNYAFADFYKRLEIRAITTAKFQLEEKEDAEVIRELRQEHLETLQDEKINLYPLSSDRSWKAIDGIEEYNSGFVEEVVTSGTATFNDQKTFYYGVVYRSSDQKDYLVLISAENYFITHHISYFRNLLFISLGVAFLIILLISFLFSRKIIEPINQIIHRVNEISTGNLHKRLPEQSDNDDAISKLTRTFNDMLNRLETSFESQKNFISNASHELNTPLTSIIGEADVALSKLREPAYYIETLMTILEDAEKLSKKTSALLLLAQTGFDGKKQKFEKLRVDQLIMDVKGTVEKINPKNQVQIDFGLLPENPSLLKIDAIEPLMHLAMSNLIINGCKYSNHKPVQVAFGVTDTQVIILVKDQGIGIPQNELQFIYDPYFRASNTKNHEGYGIGLPLARNIIRMHKGQLYVSSETGKGTVARVVIPIGS